MQLLDSFRFYLRCSLRTNPALLISSAVCLAMFVTTTVVYLARINGASANRQAAVVDTVSRPRLTPVNTAALDLPDFHTVPLVNTIERAADSAGVELDEVTFALENAPTQPFLRYRASFTLAGRYPAMRDFVEQVNTTLRYTSVDSVHCLREDIGVADVDCTVTMSALYRRAGHE